MINLLTRSIPVVEVVELGEAELFTRQSGDGMAEIFVVTRPASEAKIAFGRRCQRVV